MKSLKNGIVFLTLLIGTSSFADTVNLQTGESITIGNRTVTCNVNMPIECKNFGGYVYCPDYADQTCSNFGGYIYCGYHCENFGGYIYCGASTAERCYNFGGYIYCGQSCQNFGGYIYCDGEKAQPAKPATPAKPKN